MDIPRTSGPEGLGQCCHAGGAASYCWWDAVQFQNTIQVSQSLLAWGEPSSAWTIRRKMPRELQAPKGVTPFLPMSGLDLAPFSAPL